MNMSKLLYRVKKFPYGRKKGGRKRLDIDVERLISSGRLLKTCIGQPKHTELIYEGGKFRRA